MAVPSSTSQRWRAHDPPTSSDLRQGVEISSKASGITGYAQDDAERRRLELEQDIPPIHKHGPGINSRGRGDNDSGLPAQQEVWVEAPGWFST
jgi:hypothetical protein